jgi:hypothetical protein
VFSFVSESEINLPAQSGLCFSSTVSTLQVFPIPCSALDPGTPGRIPVGPRSKSIPSPGSESFAYPHSHRLWEVCGRPSSRARGDLCLLTLLPPDLLRVILSFLSLEDICMFDSSLLNHEPRSLYLSAAHGHQIAYANRYKRRDCLPWILNRGMLAHDLRITKEFEWFRELASKSMNTLRTLNIYSSDISDAELERIACPNLVDFTLKGCPRITTQVLRTLFSHCPGLQTFRDRKVKSLLMSFLSSSLTVPICAILIFQTTSGGRTPPWLFLPEAH